MTSPCLLVATWAAWPWSVAAFLCACAALLAAWLLHVTLLGKSDGDESLRAATAERFARALVSLATEAKAIAGFALVVLVLLLSAADSTAERFTAWSFVLGAALALLIGWIALRAASAASGRAIEAARGSEAAGFETAFTGALITGLAAAGLLLLGLCTLWFLCREPGALFGLAFGVGLVALVALAGSRGTGARAIGVSADLVATYASALCAAMALGASVVREAGLDPMQRPGLVALPLALAGAGIVASIAARRWVRLGSLWKSALVAAAVLLILAVVVIALADREPLGPSARPGSFTGLLLALVAGLGGGLAVAKATGFAHGSRRASAVAPALPAILIAALLFVANYGAARYGIAIAAVALVAPLGLVFAIKNRGAWRGDAGEPAGSGPAGESTASARGVSTAAAALTSIALLRCYCEAARISTLDLLDVNALTGLLIGALLPFLLLASARSTAVPSSTRGALRAMIVPAFVALVVPLVVGRLNPVALGGLLAGAIVCGVLLALRFARTGAVLHVLIELMSIVAVIAARR